MQPELQFSKYADFVSTMTSQRRFDLLDMATYDILSVYMESQGIKQFSTWQFNFLFNGDQFPGLFARVIIVTDIEVNAQAVAGQIIGRLGRVYTDSEGNTVSEGASEDNIPRAFQVEVYGRADTKDIYGTDLSYHEFKSYAVNGDEIQETIGEGDFMATAYRFSLNQVDTLFGHILQLPPGAGKTLISTWLIVNRLIYYPKQRIIFALPLRALATQVTQDTDKIISDIDAFTRQAWGFPFNFSTEVLEGPGRVAHPKDRNIFIATYEHAASLIRRPELLRINTGSIEVGAVIIDEVHEIMKDRGLIVDDILYFSQLHKLASLKGIPAVNVMSGTLPSWVVRRIGLAYKFVLDRKTISITSRPSTTTTVIPVNITSRSQCIAMVRDIVGNLLDQRIRNEQRKENRLVCFMNTVSDAEAMFLSLTPLAAKARQVALMDPHASPNIILNIDRDTLSNAMLDPSTPVDDIENAIRWLQAAGIYIHHANVRGSKQLVGDTLMEPKDIIIKQITNAPGIAKFTAVFSTSTISTGLNLARAQIAFLGPNTMWSVDQAQQMIGRVGRQGAGKSIAYVAQSTKYLAPGAMQIAFPDAWFIPRLTAALSFAEKLTRNGNIYDSRTDTFIPPQINEDGLLIGIGNIDVRGFYGLLNGRPVGVDDVPGNGLITTAIEWRLINERGAPTQEALQALEISGNDPLTLPVTSQFLRGFIHYETAIAWQVLMCWQTANGFNVKDMWAGIGEVITGYRLSEESKQAIREMCAVYGETHQRFPADNTVPSRDTAEQFVAFIESFIDGLISGAGRWAVLGLSTKRAQQVRMATALIDAAGIVATNMYIPPGGTTDEINDNTPTLNAITLSMGSPEDARQVMATAFRLTFPVGLLKESMEDAAREWDIMVRETGIQVNISAQQWLETFRGFTMEEEGMDEASRQAAREQGQQEQEQEPPMTWDDV